MRTQRLLVACSLALVAACGSTVPTDQRAAGDGAGLSPGTTGSAADGSTGATSGSGTSGGASTSGSGTTGSALPQGTAGSTGGSGGSSTATGATGATGSAGTGGGVTAPGTTEKSVRIGFEIIQGGNAAVSAAFGTPVNFGNGRAEIAAIVEDVNKHGGIGGRQILPFIAEWNVADGDAGRQTTCAKLTEDDKVAFILTVINMNQGFAACAAKHKVPIINASFGSGDDGLYKQVGKYLYSPSLLSLNREERIVLDVLRAAGKATPSTKVGVVIDAVNDAIAQRVYDQTVSPTLKAWKVPHESFSVATQSDASAAVLRFRSDGVKTVVFIAPSGVIEVLFMTAAENQRYRPDYGLGDSTDPWFIANAAPDEQVKRILGAGSLPISNVEVSQYPTTPREQRCLDLIAAKGEDNRDRHGSLTATLYCEAIHELTAVGSLVSGRLTADSFEAAYPRVGTTYKPVSTFATDFGNGRHDNAALYRTLGYRASCSCVTYTSGLKPVP